MQETNKNCHTNLLKFKEIARNRIFQIYDVIESFLNYTEYATLTTLTTPCCLAVSPLAYTLNTQNVCYLNLGNS